MVKKQKCVLWKYRTKTDRELLRMLKDIIYEYKVVCESGEIADKILKKYNYNYDVPRKLINKYNDLLKCARLRNLTLPEEWFEINITEQDVIDRINEIMFNEIKWLQEHNYMFDAEYEDAKDKNDTLSSEERIEKTTKFFQDIINNEIPVKSAKILS